jgi:hypothetical protein
MAAFVVRGKNERDGVDTIERFKLWFDASAAARDERVIVCR